MSSFKDHPIKKVIREQWCKPLIKHISEKLGYKLTYLGLPGTDAIDILTWIEYLNKVIAFDIGDYSKPYDSHKAKQNILILNNKLSDLERRGFLDNYSLYHGYIEEVVLKGMDRNRVSFNQSDIVTIYNLDFCNSLTVPLELNDPHTGETHSYYKTEVLRKLLELQRDLSKQNKNTKFVFYLTIHSQFWEEEAEKLFSGNNYDFYKKYYNTLTKMEEKDRNIRLLRLYIIDLIKTQFCSCQFIPEFLPTLYYQGTGKNWLLCFTIMGTYIKGASSTAPFNQSIDVLVNEKFLSPAKSGIDYLVQNNVTEKNCIKDPVKNIESYKSYKDLWLRRK